METMMMPPRRNMTHIGTIIINTGKWQQAEQDFRLKCISCTIEHGHRPCAPHRSNNTLMPPPCCHQCRHRHGRHFHCVHPVLCAPCQEVELACGQIACTTPLLDPAYARKWACCPAAGLLVAKLWFPHHCRGSSHSPSVHHNELLKH